MNYIEYAKKPTTRDELEIGSVLEKLVGATVYGDITKLTLLYSEDAIIITNRNQKPLTLLEYFNMKSLTPLNVRHLKYLDVHINVIGGSEATVSCVRYIEFKDFREVSVKRLYKLRKENNLWQICESLPG